MTLLPGHNRGTVSGMLCITLKETSIRDIGDVDLHAVWIIVKAFIVIPILRSVVALTAIRINSSWQIGTAPHKKRDELMGDGADDDDAGDNHQKEEKERRSGKCVGGGAAARKRRR